MPSVPAAARASTLQAVSGAGYPGLSALDILDNVIPFIDGEEDKLGREPTKLLGRLNGDGIVPAAVAVSAQCNRVPVRDGHTTPSPSPRSARHRRPRQQRR